MKQVLVGTLYHGEQEYDSCVRALRAQRGVSFDHFTLSDLPNKEAHDTLYRRFMENGRGYRYFLKLDADMVLRHDRALAAMVAEISDGDAAHLFMDVADWPSRLPIPGVHMFRNDCLWTGSDDRLNVDYAPELFGPSRRNCADILVDHMPNPSDFQMFRYGVHKALKATQPDRREKNMAKALLHAVILANIARHWRATQDRRLMLALIGATMTFARPEPAMAEYAGRAAREAFDALSFEEHSAEAGEFWSNEIQFFLGWITYAPKAAWKLGSDTTRQP